MKQLTLATAGFERYAKRTRRAVFLAEMERVVPWSALCTLIEPFYPKSGNRRPPIGVERMLRMYFLQQWFNLSDPAMEEALYDSQAMRRFVGIDLGREPVPDETTVYRFRHLLEAHDLGRRLFDEVQVHLAAKGQSRYRHDCRCDDHQCAVLDQECRQGARSRDASDQEGQPVVFRDEGATRC
jgi:IS5 family transposase